MEQVKAQLMFVSGFHGTSKKGNEFNMSSFYQIVKDDAAGVVSGKSMSFFTDEPLEKAWSMCQFRDIVECTLQPSDILTEPPVLVSIDKVVVKSPYLNIK